MKKVLIIMMMLITVVGTSQQLGQTYAEVIKDNPELF